MYRYQRGAPAHHNNSSSSGSGNNCAPRFPYRPPSNYFTSYGAGPGPYRTVTSGHRPIHTPRFPYRPPSIRPPATASYSTATGFCFTRPVTTSGYQAAQRPPPRSAVTGRSSTSSNPTRGYPPSTAGNSQSSGAITQPGRGRSSCDICSFAQKPPAVKEKVCHDHFSSKALRESLGVQFALVGSYFSPSCKCHHSPYPSERTKVLLSDSTLHKFLTLLPPPTPTLRVTRNMWTM